MKYVDYKNELQKPENSSILAKVKADFKAFLLNESDHPSLADLAVFSDHDFMFVTNIKINSLINNQILYSIWHTWLASNGFKYLGLQHQPILGGFSVYGDWNHGTFFGRDDNLYHVPIDSLTLVNDYDFMKQVLGKAKATYPEINWRLIDVRTEWRKA